MRQIRLRIEVTHRTVLLSLFKGRYLAARFSYRSGQYNDAFESFTIMLYPGEYLIDNRPGTNTSGQAFLPADISELSASTNFDLQNADGTPNSNNVLYRFNSVEGGVIVQVYLWSVWT